ncbi:class I SAM-dependent methyltransferase [Halovenus salina]|uniref:Class I SAM-dependent methyltransferase n=1 Tax=Halovenus salina TaxID=1510225 RepID=A0ABD5W5V6_9EURY|nr:class I SAM-dependent methyltransferase [Halovenus salina]
MTDKTHDETIDWNEFWKTADETDREGATPSSYHAIDLLPEFFEEKGVPSSFADVGCGPGDVAFTIASEHPETTVVGYDAAASVLDENRARAREDGMTNIGFEQAVLPEFEPGRKFETVFCFGTMAYVEESKRAVSHLYDAVEPGGHLVMSYVNSSGQQHYNQTIENPQQRMEADDNFDPDRFEERFKLIIEGESTLSYRAIHDAVGTWPRSFWEFTEKPDQPWAWDHVPLVWIPK